MENSMSAAMWLHKIEDVTLTGTTIVNVELGSVRMFLDQRVIEIKIGNNRAKVSTLEFMKAFKDMLDTRTFEMDEIDAEVWEIEKQNEDLTGRLDYLNAAMREIKGGY